VTDEWSHERLYSMRDDLLRDALGMLVNELRHPLQSLRSQVGLLRSGERDLLTVLEVCAVFDDQVAQLAALIDDLSVITRPDPAVLMAAREPLDLRELLTAASNAIAGFVALRGLRLMVRMDDDPVLVSGDRVRLTQAITNLLMNAARYCESGDLIHAVAFREGGNVRVHVRDTGMGIPPHLLEHVFDPFVRLHPGSAEGNGIGLTVARLVVDAHGGTLEARSDGVGRGSELTMVLPGS